MNWLYGGPSAPTSATTEPLRFDPPTFDYMVTIDPLGAPTPEQAAEVKAARKAAQRKAAKEMAIAYLLFALIAAAFALGTVVGNVTDGDVRDIDIPVPSLSGERAEPEGGQ